ncbi:MAG: hypothetical protein CMP23_17320 [Rickettsiales bacterium]|nr:hypothetical protein [Rickettsiales bacterium]|tara:strand:- start:973 stop:2301 length:1329 start_codon:yes stop_codon:yes gene_type:complete
MSRAAQLTAAFLSLLLPGCADQPLIDEANLDPATQGQPLWFELEVSIEPEAPGSSPDNPLPFSIEGHNFTLTATAMGYDRAPMADYEGCLKVHLTSGILEQLQNQNQTCPEGNLAILGGSGSAQVRVSRAYDQLRIWASDEGNGQETGSYASGSTQAIHTRLPTIAQVQTSDSTVESPLQHSYVPFLGYDPELPEEERRQLIVTTVTNDGFYVTDTSDPPGSYNSMFVFSFSRPDHLQAGDRLSKLSGIVSEFLGFTELQFPIWTVESSGNLIPEPSLLDPEIVCIGTEMEAWESSVVRLDNLLTDVSRASDCIDYNEYGQWPAILQGQCQGSEARINVVNGNTVPSWRFPECEASSECSGTERPDWCFEPRDLEYLVGVLRHTRYASPPWILEVRDCLDFPLENRPADCAQLLMHPPSGPRIAPFYQRREAPTCTYGTLHQ